MTYAETFCRVLSNVIGIDKLRLIVFGFITAMHHPVDSIAFEKRTPNCCVHEGLSLLIVPALDGKLSEDTQGVRI